MKLTPDIEILKSCLLSLRSDFNSLSEMERHQLSQDGKFLRKIECLFVKKLFDIEMVKSELGGYDPDLSPEQLFRFNAAMLWLKGVGQNNFYLNEFIGENNTIFSYPTLFDYEYDNHLFQWATRIKATQSKTDTCKLDVPDFKGIVFERWVRLYINEQFYYGSLCGAAAYIITELEEVSNKLIESLIPYEFAESPEHGVKDENNNVKCDIYIDAKGKESQLESLKELVYFYLYNYMQPTLEAYYDKQPDQVFMVEHEDQESGLDPHISFVFSNKDVLKQIRFTHFITDVNNFVTDNGTLNSQIEVEKLAIEKFINDQFAKIMSA